MIISINCYLLWNYNGEEKDLSHLEYQSRIYSCRTIEDAPEEAKSSVSLTGPRP